MEIFGGFMVMMSILGFFLAVVWLVMPFVVFTIKGKLDRTLDVLDRVEKRLATLEERLANTQSPPQCENMSPVAEPVVPCSTEENTPPALPLGT